MDYISAQVELSGEFINIPTPKCSAPPHSIALTPAELELLIEKTIQNKETIPEEAGIKDTAGKCNGLMWPCTYATNHWTAPLLTEYAKEGCPADCVPSWSREHIIKAIRH
eukprot:9899939-Ditylum_brightwellii.AAC.1